MSLDDLKYHFIIEYYQKLFGLNQVLILPFEYLQNNLENFVEKILEHANIEKSLINVPANKVVNKGLKGNTLFVKRILNHLSRPMPQFETTSEFNYVKISRNFIQKISKGIDMITPKAIHTTSDNQFKAIINDVVQDTYKSSNRTTSKLINIELSDFGYDC